MPLEGKTVILREEQPEDMPLLAAMRNDLETQAWSKTLPPDYTETMYAKRYQDREFSYDPQEGRFIMIAQPSGDFAGSISYTLSLIHISEPTRRACRSRMPSSA